LLGRLSDGVQVGTTPSGGARVTVRLKAPDNA